MSDSLSGEKVYYKINGRLAQFKQWTNTYLDWDNKWLESNIEKRLQKKVTNLGELEFIKNYLPLNQRILEAGCGTGWVVQGLSLCGYDVEGMDYAENSIALIHRIAPHLKVRVGDVYSIDVPDNFYGAYISLGVLEHNQEGPLKGLREAYRVLQPAGIAIFTVPYLNKTREKLLSKIDNNFSHSDSLSFYQYYFSQVDFTRFVTQAGFEILDIVPIGVFYGLIEDYALFRSLESHSFFHWRLRDFIYKAAQSANANFRWNTGHMLVFICKKPNR